jgi:hypothetical protein
MTTDVLAAALAVEEHQQGRPYLADPEHCARCAEVDRAWMQAICEHADWVDLTAFGSPQLQRLCDQCGHLWEVER